MRRRRREISLKELPPPLLKKLVTAKPFFQTDRRDFQVQAVSFN